MPSTALKIIPLISNENDHATLIADPNFIKQYVALLEPLNTKFHLCEVSYPGIHQALFTYIVGYNFGETFIVLKMIGDILVDYQGDINLAWKTGVKTITDNLFKQVNLATFVITKEIISKAMKVLIKKSLFGKSVDGDIIIGRMKSFKTMKAELETIEKELPSRKIYCRLHPKTAAMVDGMLEKIIKADTEYKRITRPVLSYNQQLNDFLAEETLTENMYPVIQEAVSFLDKFKQGKDPSIDYETCLGVLYKADKFVDEYYNNDYNKRRAANPI